MDWRKAVVVKIDIEAEEAKTLCEQIGVYFLEADGPAGDLIRTIRDFLNEVEECK